MTTGFAFVVVTKKDTKIPTKKNSSEVLINVCLDCGRLFDLRANNPKNLTVKL